MVQETNELKSFQFLKDIIELGIISDKFNQINTKLGIISDKYSSTPSLIPIVAEKKNRHE